MKLDHLAVWTRDIDRLAAFWPLDRTGLAHIALSLGGEAAVDAAAARLAAHLVAKPRRTGDGYYEAIFRDPDGNLVELVA